MDKSTEGSEEGMEAVAGMLEEVGALAGELAEAGFCAITCGEHKAKMAAMSANFTSEKVPSDNEWACLPA